MPSVIHSYPLKHELALYLALVEKDKIIRLQSYQVFNILNVVIF